MATEKKKFTVLKDGTRINGARKTGDVVSLYEGEAKYFEMNGQIAPVKPKGAKK